MEQSDSRSAHSSGTATDEPVLPCIPAAGDPPGASNPPPRDILDFEPVPVRARVDGWTPQRQRDFIEALADTGIVREAAARVGMSEQGVARLRRRAEGWSFDIACEAAQRLGARRLRSIAWERAIEGTVRRHYWRGEVVGEDRVYDTRLLLHLLGKVEPFLQPGGHEARVAANWEEAMAALEAGRSFSHHDSLCAEEGPDDPRRERVEEVWQEEGLWWTSFPPPAGFEGEEEGGFGDEGYRRRLTDAEEAAVFADLAREREAMLTRECERRDRCFRFAGGIPWKEANSHRAAAEPSTLTEPSGPSDSTGRGGRSGKRRLCGRRAPCHSRLDEDEPARSGRGRPARRRPACRSPGRRGKG